MSTIACIGCGHLALNRLRPYRLFSREGATVFGTTWLRSCGKCGLVQAQPRPSRDGLVRYFASDYRKAGRLGSDVADLNQFPRDNLVLFNRARSIVELVASHINRPDPRCIDIGAGYGHFLALFRERFPQSSGLAVEFSSACIDHLQSIGFGVCSKPIESAWPEMTECVDLVVASHVLDYLLDPCTALRSLHAKLGSQGLLYVSVRNFPPESLLLHPDHPWVLRGDEARLNFFSEPTLRGLLESCGFEIQFCNTVGPEYRYISSFRFRLPQLKSLLHGIIPKPLFLFLRRQNFTSVFRVPERDESFYQHGGRRIWIHCICKIKKESA